MSTSRPASDNSPLPGTFMRFTRRFPRLAAAHQSIAQAVEDEGHLDRRTSELIKIGICVGGGLESALRSHVRRARQAGASIAEIEQAIVLGMNTVGFPRTVAAWSWAHQQFERDAADADPRDNEVPSKNAGAGDPTPAMGNSPAARTSGSCAEGGR